MRSPALSHGVTAGGDELAQPNGATVATYSFAAAIAVCVYAHALQKPLDHDEHQFIASAALIAREGLVPYRDFPYFHLPYLSYLYAAAFLVSDHLLLTARLVAATAALAVAALVWRRARSMLTGVADAVATAGAAACVLVLVTNPMFLYTAGRAWNHDVAILAALASTIALAGAPEAKRPTLAAMIAGALLGIAIGTRSTMALLAPPLLLAAALSSDRGWTLLSRASLPGGFAIGVALAQAPLAALYALAPEKFVYGNVTYNLVLNTRYRHETGYDVAMSDTQKLGYLVDVVLAHPRNAALLLAYFVSALVAVVAVRRSPQAREARSSRFAVTVALCLPFLLIAAQLPTPTWYQYYYALVPFLVVGAIANLGACGATHYRWIGIAAALPALVGAVTGARYYRPYLFITPPAEWTAISVHETGRKIASLHDTERVLTLGPTFPLEGGLGIHPALATGAFAWRTAPLVEHDERVRLGLFGPDELATLEASDHPFAVLTGVERDPDENLEASLLEHVSGGAWAPTSVGEELTLWLPPRK